VKAVSAIRIRGVVEVKEGKSEEFRQACRELVEAVREGEPDTVSYGTFLDEATGTGIFLEHYSDSAGMLAHLKNAEPYFPKVYEFTEPQSIEVYGKPTPELMAALDAFEISMTFYSGVATKD
jgi:quinol monooxygenase YgiN